MCGNNNIKIRKVAISVGNRKEASSGLNCIFISYFLSCLVGTVYIFLHA